jgi:O-antigen ligase
MSAGSRRPGTGLFGAAAWLLWCAWIFRESNRERKRGASSASGLVFAAAWIAAWVAFHLNGLTQVNFWEGKVSHQMVLMVSLSLLAAAEGSRSRRAAEA